MLRVHPGRSCTDQLDVVHKHLAAVTLHGTDPGQARSCSQPSWRILRRSAWAPEATSRVVTGSVRIATDRQIVSSQTRTTAPQKLWRSLDFQPIQADRMAGTRSIAHGLFWPFAVFAAEQEVIIQAGEVYFPTRRIRDTHQLVNSSVFGPYRRRRTCNLSR